MAFGRRRQTDNQFEEMLGQGEMMENERNMTDLMTDLMFSEKKHTHNKANGLESSKEYNDVQQAVKNISFGLSEQFTADAGKNDKMVTQMLGNYYKLLSACEIYINKKGGMSISGRARKNKVKEIQKYAQRDVKGIEQVIYVMRSMSAQQQKDLTWEEILHSARMDTIEVDDYYNTKKLGAGVKSGETAGRLLKEGVFVPETINTYNMRVNVRGEKLWDNQERGASITSNTFHDPEKTNEMCDKGTNTSVTNRNVATSRVANLIGLGGIVEQSTLATVKDKKTGTEKKGILMSVARGTEVKEDFENNVYPKMLKETDTDKREADAKKLIAPSMQKELSSLQVLDYLCAQGDRHRANYFAEKNSENQYSHVHGIDNDTAFSTGADADEFLKTKMNKSFGGGVNWRLVVDSEDNLVIPHMDKQLAKNILDLKPEELRFALKDLLEDVFVDAALERLKKLQTALKKEFGKVDSNKFLEDGDWGEETMEDFLNASIRRKVENSAKLKKFEQNFLYRLQREDRYELSREDNYISALVDDLVGYIGDHDYYMLKS